MRRPMPMGPTWRRNAPASPASSPEPCEVSTAGRIATLPRPVADRWGKGSTRPSVTSPPWMRGVFHSKPTVPMRSVAPIGYSIPMDGPVGELVKRTEISEMRPAHIHFCIEAPGYHRGGDPSAFRRGCPYIETDAPRWVKALLIVDFVEHPLGIAPNGDKTDTLCSIRSPTTSSCSRRPSGGSVRSQASFRGARLRANPESRRLRAQARVPE